MNILTLNFVKAAVFIINNHFGRSVIVSIYPNHVSFKNVALILKKGVGGWLVVIVL